MPDLLSRRLKSECLENLRVLLNVAFNSWSPSGRNVSAEMEMLNGKRDCRQNQERPISTPAFESTSGMNDSCALVHYRREIWSHRKFSWFRMKIFVMFRRRAIVFSNCFNKLCSFELKNNLKLSQIRLIFCLHPPASWNSPQRLCNYLCWRCCSRYQNDE